MSLPLTRRIAKAALLTAAGAASVIGATGSAGAVDLQQATDLGGLSNPDTAGVTETAGEATGHATGVGGGALKGGVPTNDLLTDAGQSVTPVADGTVDETLDTANGELGQTALQTAHNNLPTGDLPTGDVTGGGLPTGSVLA